VARFYSPEWVAAFNEAVADLDVRPLDAGGSLAAGSGRFRVAQLVRGGPEGDITVTMVVEEGRLALGLGSTSGPEQPGLCPPAERSEQPNVTIILHHDDAVSLSRGQLDPAEAIAQGRIRVRGDLAVLVALQQLLREAAHRLSALHAATTYE
jgi:hypothetical protein